MQGWGDGLITKSLASQRCGPEFRSPEPMLKKQAWLHASVILERQENRDRQTDP